MVRPITLVNYDTSTTDELGQIIEVETTTDLFAEVESISQSEFMQAGQIGLKPQYKFKIWMHEYNNQKVLIFENVRYSIYRTYLAKDGRIELFTEERIGENNS